MHCTAPALDIPQEEDVKLPEPAPRDDRGATAVEYGLMVAFIAIVIIGAVTVFGLGVSDLFLVPAGVFK